MSDTAIQFKNNKILFDVVSKKAMLALEEPEPPDLDCNRSGCGENTPDYITLELTNFIGATAFDINPEYPGGAMAYFYTTGSLNGLYVLCRVTRCKWEVTCLGGIGLVLQRRDYDPIADEYGPWYGIAWATPIYSILQIYRMGPPEQIWWRWASFVSIVGDFGAGITTPGQAWYYGDDSVRRIADGPWPSGLLYQNSFSASNISGCAGTNGQLDVQGAGPYGTAWSPKLQTWDGVQF